MKRLLFALLLAAALALPGQAAAKEQLTAVQICGASGCKTISGADNLRGFPTTGDPDGTVPGPAPYYRIRFVHGADQGRSWATWYVPSAQMLAAPDDRAGLAWMPIDGSAMAKAVAGVKPFSKPEISAVTIGSRRVTDDPQSYFRLYTVKSAGEAVPSGLADWVPITFSSKRKTPWTMARSGLYYSPENGMVQRGIEIVKLPGDMATSVRAGHSLAGGSSVPWRKVIFLLLGAAALIGAAGAVPVRRRMLMRRQPTPA